MPILHLGCTIYGLVVILSWIDDLLIFGKREGVLHYKKKIIDLIDCHDIGPLMDYIGNKIEFNHDEPWVRLTQPVLLRSFKDKFTFSKPNRCLKTPAIPGSVLRAGMAKEGKSAKDQKAYCSGVGKVLFLMKWSWPDVLNSQGLKPIHELGMTLTFNGHGTCHAILVEFWGLPPLILFFNMSTGWFGRFVLSTIVNQNKEAWLQESKLAKKLCTGCREFGTNR